MKERLKHNRLVKDRKEEALKLLKRQKLVEEDNVATISSAVHDSTAMEIISNNETANGLLKVASAVSDVPPPAPESAVLQKADNDLDAKLSNASKEEVLETPASLNTSAPVSEHFGSGLPEDFCGEYELMGVVTHKGRSADAGHYIGWVRQAPESSYWWKYDDDVVTEVTTADILNLKGGGDWHSAYLNFYRFKN